ncbi:MAG: hypothetical protein RBU37_06870 [Myxococcota bacterium]|jgi:protein TonB|nr:hypothetical protein [Myxococcota bacterium]
MNAMPRIIDEVFSRRPPDATVILLVALGLVGSLFGSGALLLGGELARSSIAAPALAEPALVELETVPVPEPELVQPAALPEQESETAMVEEEPPDPTLTEPPPAGPPPAQTPPKPAPKEHASAGALMTRADDGPVDLSADAFVTGIGAIHAGGWTRRDGRSSQAAHELPTPPLPAPEPAPVTEPPKAKPRKSKAQPVGLPSAQWSCPWPSLGEGGPDKRVVIIRVHTDAAGVVQRVDILRDPGDGFGDAARQCALASTFTPALDDDGQPKAAKSAPIRVRFER